jgi:hypothetical protein
MFILRVWWESSSGTTEGGEEEADITRTTEEEDGVLCCTNWTIGDGIQYKKVPGDEYMLQSRNGHQGPKNPTYGSMA